MQARFTHAWTSALPTRELQLLALEDWSEQLAGLTAEQIAHGFDVMACEYPPTATKFREYCTGQGSDGKHNTAAYRVNFTHQRITRQDRMIEKKQDKTKGREALKEIREKMGA